MIQLVELAGLSVLRDERGFNLLEVLLALALIFVVFTAISVLNSTAWRYWERNQEKIDLKQQARVITKFLNRDIRVAVDLRAEDLDGDGRNELYLNLGDYPGDGDNTDLDTDYYLKYEIAGRKLAFKKTNSAFNISGVSYPDWPAPTDWGRSRSITLEIIQNYSFGFERRSAPAAYFFELEQAGEEYRVEGKIFPRLLK